VAFKLKVAPSFQVSICDFHPGNVSSELQAALNWAITDCTKCARSFFLGLNRDDNKSSAIRVSAPKFLQSTAGAAALPAVSRVGSLSDAPD
jgi:hypothetical protein